MKKELINELFGKFEDARYIYEGIECWSARELQTILGYAKWDNFSKVIDKAKTACESSGVAVKNHFPGIGKMVVLGSGSEREIEDIALTRYACYLVAQNGKRGVKFEALPPAEDAAKLKRKLDSDEKGVLKK